MRTGLGPVPPSEWDWADGKTAFSINFVLNARDYIADHPDISPANLSKLQSEMIALMTGTDSLLADIDVGAWLQSGEEPPTTIVNTSLVVGELGAYVDGAMTLDAQPTEVLATISATADASGEADGTSEDSGDLENST